MFRCEILCCVGPDCVARSFWISTLSIQFKNACRGHCICCPSCSPFGCIRFFALWEVSFRFMGFHFPSGVTKSVPIPILLIINCLIPKGGRQLHRISYFHLRRYDISAATWIPLIKRIHSTVQSSPNNRKILRRCKGKPKPTTEQPSNYLHSKIERNLYPWLCKFPKST